MAQPTTYNRVYSFSSFQAASPSAPLPASQVDAELNAIKQTLDELLANLELIQRDDGELANAVVGQEQLASSVTIGVAEPTAWVTLTDYAVSDTVFEAYKFYICATAHTSGTFATDLAAEKWTLVADFSTVFSDANADAAAAAASAAAALVSENAASSSASAASGSASTASTHASTATTQASAASVSAAAALVSENAAAASASAAANYGTQYKGTSTSSVAIATGSKAFTTQSGKFFDVGVWLLIASDADSANFMHGYVTAYSGTSLTVEVTNIGGSGTLADWTITVAGTRGATGATGAAGAGSGDMLAANNLSDVTTPATARTNLGLGTANTPQFTGIEVGHASDTTVTRASAADIAVEGNRIFRVGGADVPVADGGTGASTAADARTNLGLVIGTNVQAWDTDLDAIAALAKTDSNFIVGNGSAWVAESGATVRTSLGLGTGDSPQFTAVNIGAATDTTVARVSAGDISVEGNRIFRVGGADVPLADGGTGASDAATARSNLGAAAKVTSGTLPVDYSGFMNYTSSTALANGDSTAGTNVKTVVAHGSGFSAGDGTVQTGTWINESGVTLDANGAEQFGQMRRTA